jgi:hypothetical protein
MSWEQMFCRGTFCVCVCVGGGGGGILNGFQLNFTHRLIVSKYMYLCMNFESIDRNFTLNIIANIVALGAKVRVKYKVICH